MVICRSVLIRVINVSAETCKEIQTQILCSMFIFSRKSLRLYVEKYCKDGQATACGLHAGYLRLKTHTGPILTASPLQQWMHECASVLHYAYTACLVSIYRVFQEEY